MADIVERIRRDVEDDVALKVHAFTVDLVSSGFLARRRVLRVSGTVAREHDRDALERIVNYHAGDAYQVELDVAVDEHARA